MAARKTKKPTSKLKAGKKNKVNKWLIVGGVAAVTIIGVAVVRFSSAARINYKYATPLSMKCPSGYKLYSAGYSSTIKGLRCQRQVLSQWYYKNPLSFGCPVSYKKYIDTRLVAFCRRLP